MGYFDKQRESEEKQIILMLSNSTLHYTISSCMVKHTYTYIHFNLGLNSMLNLTWNLNNIIFNNLSWIAHVQLSDVESQITSFWDHNFSPNTIPSKQNTFKILTRWYCKVLNRKFTLKHARLVQHMRYIKGGFTN